MADVIFSANVEFKSKYGKYVRNALIGAVVIHFLIFFFSPPFTFKPYKLKEERFEVVELPQNIEIPPPPKEVALPQVPVEAAEGEEETDEETDRRFAGLVGSPYRTACWADESAPVCLIRALTCHCRGGCI